MISIKVDTKQLEKACKRLEGFPKEVPKALNAALNRTSTTVQKELKKCVIKKYNIKSGEVAGTLKIKKASSSNLSVNIISTGKVLALDHFPSNINTVFRNSGKGKKTVVKVGVKKGSKKAVAGAFVNTLGGNMHILKRVGSSRLPIEKLNTLSIPQMISNIEVSNNIQKTANDILETRIYHEVQYRLSKLGEV